MCLLIDADVDSYAFHLCLDPCAIIPTGPPPFRLADVGAPGGIKCDMDGSEYCHSSGCDDITHVWSAGDVLLDQVHMTSFYP
jgi:hypothetical protein